VINEARAMVRRIDSRLAFIDGRLADLGDERERLVALRASLDRFIEHPELSEEPPVHPGRDGDSAPESQPEQGEDVRAEQPAASSQGATDAAPAPASLLVACPQCGLRVRPQGLGSHQRKHKPGYRGAASSTDRTRRQRAAAELEDMVPNASSDDARPREFSPATRTAAKARDERIIAAGPYSCDGCGREFSRPQGVGRHRPFCSGARGPDGGGRGEAAEEQLASPSVRGGQARSKATRPERERSYAERQKRLVCEDCGRELGSPQAYATHREERHPADHSRPTPAPAPEPARLSKHKYVCSRCPAEFLSRAGRDEHQAGHPPVPPAREPMQPARATVGIRAAQP
jgi:hypothetical protein